MPRVYSVSRVSCQTDAREEMTSQGADDGLLNGCIKEEKWGKDIRRIEGGRA